MKRFYVLVLFLLILAQTTMAEECQVLKYQLDNATAQLELASIRSDSTGISQAKQRLQRLLSSVALPSPDSSLVRDVKYRIAFANFQQLWMTYGRRPDALSLLREAVTHLDEIRTSAETSVEVPVLSGLCEFYLTFLDTASGSDHSRKMKAHFDRAEAISPNDPTLLFARGFMTGFSTPAQSRSYLRRAAEHFSTNPSEKPLETWWRLANLFTLATSYVFANKPDSSKLWTGKALEITSDYEYIRSTLLPQFEIKNPRSPMRMASIPWHHLSRDAKGDGQNASLADGKALLWHYDVDGDSLWFRIDYHESQDFTTFGANLVFDTDRNQTNGLPWWGGNRNFKFDTVVTLWLRRDANGNYWGTSGISGAQNASVGRYMKPYANNIDFSLAPDGKSLYVGCDRKELCITGKVNMIAAVGSSTAWNDDLVDSEFVTIDLSR